MANISHDGQSFLIDNRRIWLVSGAVHYARTPRELWRQRLRAAKQAGLNCIDTYVFWNLHEPQPGTFRFDGDADLRAFVQMIGEEGLYCILRPGPYVCSEWDFGGLPAWLHEPHAGHQAAAVEPRIPPGHRPLPRRRDASRWPTCR
jgi:beta-galactosidase